MCCTDRQTVPFSPALNAPPLWPLTLYPLVPDLSLSAVCLSSCTSGAPQHLQLRKQECRNVDERQGRPGPPPRILHRPSARGQPSFRSAAHKLGAGGAGGGRRVQRPARRSVSRGGGTPRVSADTRAAAPLHRSAAGGLQRSLPASRPRRHLRCCISAPRPERIRCRMVDACASRWLRAQLQSPTGKDRAADAACSCCSFCDSAALLWCEER